MQCNAINIRCFFLVPFCIFILLSGMIHIRCIPTLMPFGIIFSAVELYYIPLVSSLSSFSLLFQGICLMGAQNI